MINVCVNCGAYRADKIIDPSGPYAICPTCGHKHPFLRLPLLTVGGASCTGKSAVCDVLLGRIRKVVLLEGDLLWRAEFDTPQDRYRDFHETWLRLCKSISQSGRPVVMFNAGMGVPENVEGCVERRYFSEVPTQYDEILIQRDHLMPFSHAYCASPEPESREGWGEQMINFLKERNRWDAVRPHIVRRGL